MIIIILFYFILLFRMNISSTPSNSSTTLPWWINWWTEAESEWGFFHYYFVGYALPVICVIGLIENILSIWVLFLIS